VESKAIPVTGCRGLIGFRDIEGLNIPDTWLRDGSEVVSLTLRPIFSPQENSWHLFLLELESTPRTTVRLEGLGKLRKMKTAMTSQGMEHLTLRIVAQCRNQLRYAGPLFKIRTTTKPDLLYEPRCIMPSVCNVAAVSAVSNPPAYECPPSSLGSYPEEGGSRFLPNAGTALNSMRGENNLHSGLISSGISQCALSALTPEHLTQPSPPSSRGSFHSRRQLGTN
jgi:hypothetical protein